MGLGDVFAAVFELYKRRWQLFVGIALLPAALVAVALVVYLVAVFALVVGANATSTPDVAAVVATAVVSLLAFVVVVLLITALQYRFYGMIALGALDLVQGRTPTFGDLFARTRGVALRALGVVLALGLALTAVYGLVAGVAIALLAPQAYAGDTSGTGWVVALIVGATVAGVVVSILLTVRWLYFVPVLAIEGRAGFASLGRSWQLTRGAFWRTLGYYLVGGLVVGAPSMLVSGMSQSLVPTGAAESFDTTALLAPTIGVALLSVALTVVTAPFMELFRTVMYFDQLGRTR